MLLGTVLIVACQPQTVEVEVTRVVTEIETVSEEVEVEVTRVVTEMETVTEEVEVEVTRIVEQESDPEPVTLTVMNWSQEQA
ncbi:MAG: hypothetical protein AAF633_06285 [Chloroflexota bacterium]